MIKHVHKWEGKPKRQRGEVYKDYQKRLARLDKIIKYFTDREMRCFLAWTRDKKETRWSSPEAKFFCGAGATYIPQRKVFIYSEPWSSVMEVKTLPTLGPHGSKHGYQEET